MFHSIWDTHSALEEVASTAKHDPDNMDSDKVRGVCRMAQDDLNIISRFRSPEEVRAFKEDGMYRVVVEVLVDPDDVETLLAALWPDIDLTKED